LTGLLAFILLTALASCAGRTGLPLEPGPAAAPGGPGGAAPGRSLALAAAPAAALPAVTRQAALPLPADQVPPTAAARLEVLQAELARSVSAEAIPLHAPQREDSRPLLSVVREYIEDEAPGTVPPYHIKWTEQLPGDLDLNGEVNAADIIPLARYFNLDQSGFLALQPDGYDLFRQLDADGNGLIGSSDLQVIAAHFHEHIDGYRVYRRQPGGAWHYLPDPASATHPLTAPRADLVARAGAAALSGPLACEYIDNPAPGDYQYKVVPCFTLAPQEGIASFVSPVIVFAAGTDFPISPATLAWPDSTAIAGQPYAANFNFAPVEASAFPVTLRFDTDSDGEYDFDATVPAGTGELAQAVALPPPGPHQVVVLYTDALGRRGFWSWWVTVRAANHAPHVSLQLDLPDRTVPCQLKVLDNSSDPDGDALTTSLTLQHGGEPSQPFNGTQVCWEPGDYVVAAEAVDPFGASATAQLSFTLNSDQTASPQWDITTLPYAAGTRFHSWTSIGRKPAVTFTEDTAAAAKFARALDTRGTQWPAAAGAATLPPLPASPDTLSSTSLREVNGRPAVLQLYGGSIRNLFGFKLDLVVANDSEAASWAAPVTLPVPGIYLASGKEFALAGGRPAFTAPKDGAQVFYRALDESGSAWPDTPQTIGSASGYDSRLVQVGDHLAVFFTTQDSRLSFVRSSDTAGSSWSAPVSVPGAADSIVLALPSGRPLIISQQHSNSSSRYELYATQALTDSWGTWSPLQRLPAFFSSTTSRTLDSMFVMSGGKVCAVYADPAGLQVLYSASPDGLPASWSTPAVVDNRGACGDDCTALDVDGQPAAFYRVQTGPAVGTADPPLEVRFARMK
jgi:hypothetical protein